MCIRDRYSVVLFLDVILFQAAWFLSHVFRFEGVNFSKSNQDAYLTGCWLIPAVIFPLMLLGGVYRHPFKYFSIKDLLRLFIVTTSSWVLAIFIQFGFFQRSLSIGIAILSLFIFVGALILPRLFYREKWIKENPVGLDNVRNVVIYGAGKKGSALVKFLEQGFNDVKVVGILDEDIEVIGRYINGVKVLGRWRDCESVFSRYRVSELWVAENNILIDELEVEDWVVRQGCKYKTISKF